MAIPVLPFRAQEKIKKCLSRELVTVRRALEELYPSSELTRHRGHQLLHLLSVPSARRDPKKHKGKRWPYARPRGEAWHEWKYLEGVFAGWDWDAIRGWAEQPLGRGDTRNRFEPRFPKREPPYPVTHWPLVTPVPNRRLWVQTREGRGLDLTGLAQPITCACWLLFVNEIPYELWPRVIVILLDHRGRLERLANILKRLQDDRWADDMLSPQKREAFLQALIHLIPESDIDEQEQAAVTRAVMDVSWGMEKSEYFQEEKYLPSLKLNEELEGSWAELQGPGKRYRKDAARYLRPLVSDLYDDLKGNLQRIFGEDPSRFSDFPPLPSWLYQDTSCVEGDAISSRAIYRIIGDLVRFFFPWESPFFLRGALEPPRWRGDRPWTLSPEKLLERDASDGKRWREQFGKRMESIHVG